LWLAGASVCSLLSQFAAWYAMVTVFKPVFIHEVVLPIGTKRFHVFCPFKKEWNK
jgi:hypothetical protein